MHIPDGFLDTKTILATSAFSLIGISRAIRNVTTHLPPRAIPLMGLTAAFIFVAQMVNFPVIGGTSGHLLGAVLASVLLGPSAGVLVMTVVLVVQCLLFADGGVLALGANLFNMALVASVGGYYCYRGIYEVLPTTYGRLVAITFAAWLSTVMASLCCTGELAWSGTVNWSIGFPAMTGIHMLIGIGEGLITTLIVAAVLMTRPEIFHQTALTGQQSSRPVTDSIIYGGLILIGIVLFVTPFASSWPDGLETVAAQFGFESRAIAQPIIASPFSDYQIPGIGSLSFATVLAGVIGGVVVLLFSLVLARVLVRRTVTK